MGMAVGAFVITHIHCPYFEVVMIVINGFGSNVFQILFDILYQKRLVLVQDQSGSGMQALDVNQAVLDLGVGHDLFHFVGNILEVEFFFHLVFQNFVRSVHMSCNPEKGQKLKINYIL